MHTSSMTQSPNSPKVEFHLPDFGYVEFKNSEDAEIAFNHHNHYINGKKASLQFFKTKDEQKKVSYIQESSERTEEIQNYQGLLSQGYLHSKSSQFGGESFSQLRYTPNHTSSSFQQEFRGGARQFGHSGPQRNSMVQPGNSKSSSKALLFQNFYSSLTRANNGRMMAGIYELENLRFNLPLPRLAFY